MSIDKALFTKFVEEGSLTPLQVEEIVGNKKYVSKYIFMLRKAGHTITTSKNGRTITKYTYCSAPATTEAKPAQTFLDVPQQTKEDLESEPRETSYQIDPDWDKVDVSDLYKVFKDDTT